MIVPYLRNTFLSFTILLLVPLAAGCSDDDVQDPPPADAPIVRSADGVVTLEIPAGAMPEGTTITIEPSTESGLGGVLDGMVYRFEPSGLEFQVPVELRFDLSQLDPAPEDGEFEIMFLGDLVDRDGATVRGLQHFESSLDGTILSTDIEHFSTYAVGFAFPRHLSLPEAAWDATSESVIASWTYAPQPLLCHRACPHDWTQQFHTIFERAHDPSGTVGDLAPSNLDYSVVGAAGVAEESFRAAGNPNAPNDTTVFLKSIEAGFWGTTYHQTFPQAWPGVRASGGQPPASQTNGICTVDGQQFEIKLSAANLSCTRGSCPQQMSVDVEIDWLTADPGGYNADIPLRIARTGPSAAVSDPNYDAAWDVSFGGDQRDYTATVTTNTGADQRTIYIPTAAMEANTNFNQWVFALEYGLFAPSGPLDSLVYLAAEQTHLDASGCNANPLTVTVDIQ